MEIKRFEFFVDWIETIFITKLGIDIEKLTLEEKRKKIPDWFKYMIMMNFWLLKVV